MEAAPFLNIQKGLKGRGCPGKGPEGGEPLGSLGGCGGQCDRRKVFQEKKKHIVFTGQLIMG